MEDNYYQRLQVSREASQVEIAKAFRSLAMAHHPDKTSDPDAVSDFKHLSEAYNTLKDADLRSRYDTQVFISSLLTPTRPESSTPKESVSLDNLVSMVKNIFKERDPPFTPNDVDEMESFVEHNTVNGCCQLCQATLTQHWGRSHFLTEHFAQFRSWKRRPAPAPAKRRKVA